MLPYLGTGVQKGNCAKWRDELNDLCKSLLDHTPDRLIPRRPGVDVRAIFFSGVQYRGMVQGAAPGMVASVRTGP